MKKIILLAIATALLSVLAAPAVSSATTTEWTKTGATLTTNDNLHFEGTTSYSSATLGGFHCTSKFTMTMELIGGTHNATLKTFEDTAASTDCHVSGFLASTCGTKSLTSSQLLKHATVTGTLGTKQLDISGIEQRYTFGASGSCLTLTLSGSAIATLDSETAATQITLSGELDTGGWGKMKLGGTYAITSGQKGLYGIKTF
jgi:opacity protein-like surface antigen